MDTLSNLKAFIAVADAGSFSEVARRQQVAPSVITKRIAQLEWRIRRTTRKRTAKRTASSCYYCYLFVLHGGLQWQGGHRFEESGKNAHSA